METRTVNTILLVSMIGVLIISFPQIYGLLVNTMNLNSTGIVADMDVEIFRDQAGTEALTTIDWGECSPGARKTQTLYIKNVGTINTSLTFQTQDWNPAGASSYLVVGTCAPYANPVGYWQFDEGAGNTVGDASGFHHPGVSTNTEWVSGRFGSALMFSENSMVTIPHDAMFNVSTQVTVAAWIRPTQLDAFTRIVAKSYSINQRPWTIYGLLLDANGHLRIEVSIDGSQQSLDGSTPLPLNDWVHVAGTYDGNEVRLYVNGVLDASRALEGSIDSNTMPITIGASGYNADYFQGSIDEVRIYSRALTVSEIGALTSTTQPPSVDPTHHGTCALTPNQIIEVKCTLIVSKDVAELDQFTFNIRVTSEPPN